ncbi:MAG TPA: hypothetical protein VHL31_09715 [Geminicoccus sp.]|uniref:hypothetical protein n=1 Tax=Geminicoccus sp. TaxID=2024832 RepID=UPI002E37CCD5|nr:hypothetical protein [Geminicoccus sp.]HEX2526556.1 hypothetical protein [Geminicoccus sp.]
MNEQVGRPLVSVEVYLWDQDVVRLEALSRILAADTEASQRLRTRIEEILEAAPLQGFGDT